MSWASRHIENLRQGQWVEVKSIGDDLGEVAPHNSKVMLIPVDEHAHLRKGDIVLCLVENKHRLLLVKKRGWDTFVVGNTKGDFQRKIGRSKIYGVATLLEKDGLT